MRWGVEVGGAWSCCLPCAGGGGRGAPGGGSGVTPCGTSGGHGGGSNGGNGASGNNSGRTVKKSSSIILCGHPHRRRSNQKGSSGGGKRGNEKNNLDQDFDDLEALNAAIEAAAEATPGCFTGKRSSHQSQEDNNKDGGTQHRLSPRLHDIEEEDDEECRHTKGRTYQKKSPTPSTGGIGSRTGWRSRRSVTTAGQHHVIASAAATAQAKMQAEQGSIGELRGYHNLRSRRHTLANVR
ncbi:hypothetical protein PV326_006940 [Microctonus aethiopoides]|nr:hypothetical protein PV326_006940 [Microctonus aethiopoides]